MKISESNQTTAFLYTRVSTEEQALRGGSLKTQEDTLLQYCLLCNIKIEKMFIEDHSAKTFNRPEWKKLFADIENSSQRPTLLLFTRWDRFSRNTADAYHTIKVLKKLGVETQAVEQPLDLSVPENKMMLAFYLAIPEVENDRRGLNTKMGIQRAKERGRVVGKAPMGYINHCYANGLKAILPKELDSNVVLEIFGEYYKTQYMLVISKLRNKINQGFIRFRVCTKVLYLKKRLIRYKLFYLQTVKGDNVTAMLIIKFL